MQSGQAIVPQNVFKSFNPGNTIGEIFGKHITPQTDRTFEFGGVYVNEIEPGILHGVFHAKLPVLEKPMVYKIAISPSLDFLSGGGELDTKEVASVPMYIDNRELTIARLETISIKLAEIPNLSSENDYTTLEKKGRFDSHGYSIEPIFQSSIDIDMTTFNDKEDVVLSLSWRNAAGISYPIGLANSDIAGNLKIGETPHFSVKRTQTPTVKLPLVAHITRDVQSAMLREATFIKSIGSQSVADANFDLVISYVDADSVVTLTSIYPLFLPLVSQDSSPRLLLADDANRFEVLRAGSTNTACLTTSSTAYDIDTGMLRGDSVGIVNAENCPTSQNDAALWRYDVSTKHLVSKEVDSDGNNHCLVATGENFAPTTFSIAICKYKGNGYNLQQFVFEGNKLRLSTIPIYIGVNFGAQPQSLFAAYDSNQADATDIFTDLNGLEIDVNGRIFSAKKYYEREWGDADTAQVTMSYGGEANVDYMPVIGAGAKGHVDVNASLLGLNQEVINTQFSIQRHLTKKLSLFGDNYPDTMVENGTILKIDLFGLSAIDQGSMSSTNVTETFSAGDATDYALGTMPYNANIDIYYAPVQNELDLNKKFVDVTIIVFAVPVTIEGGIRMSLVFDVGLSSPAAGIVVDAAESIVLSGYLSAKLDALIVAAGLEAKFDVVNQKLNFSINSGFTALSVNTLDYIMEASIDAELKILNGEASGFIEYKSPCWCAPPWETVRKEKTLFDFDYLFNDSWVLLDKKVSSTLIQL